MQAEGSAKAVLPVLTVWPIMTAMEDRQERVSGILLESRIIMIAEASVPGTACGAGLEK